MLSEFKFGFWLKPKVIDSWNARCDFVAMKYQEGHVGVLECDHGLESARARQLWLEIVCDGKVSPIKPKCNVAHGRRRSHATSKCSSAHGRRQTHVEKIDQTFKSKCINSALQKRNGCEKRRCNTQQVRIRLRQKCPERFMYIHRLYEPAVFDLQEMEYIDSL